MIIYHHVHMLYRLRYTISYLCFNVLDIAVLEGHRTLFVNVLCKQTMYTTITLVTPQVGLEPTTHRLTADCSTTELLKIIF